MKNWIYQAAGVPLLWGAALACSVAAGPAEQGLIPSSETGKYAVQVNGNETGLKGYLMVPLRGTAEELGFKVSWDNGVVLIERGDVGARILMGKDRYVTENRSGGTLRTSAPFVLGSAPYVSEGTAYVPLALFDILLKGSGDEIRIDRGQLLIRTGDGVHTGVEDVYTDYATLEAGEEAAGFGLTLPDKPLGLKDRSVRAVPGDMLEVQFQGKDELRFRKGRGIRDISGDHNVYSQSYAVDVDHIFVTLKGKDGKIYLAAWTDGRFSYSITSREGISEKQMLKWVRVVK